MSETRVALSWKMAQSQRSYALRSVCFSKLFEFCLLANAIAANSTVTVTVNCFLASSVRSTQIRALSIFRGARKVIIVVAEPALAMNTISEASLAVAAPTTESVPDIRCCWLNSEGTRSTGASSCRIRPNAKGTRIKSFCATKTTFTMNAICITALRNAVHSAIRIPNMWVYRLVVEGAVWACRERVLSTEAALLVYAICFATSFVNVLVYTFLIPGVERAWSVLECAICH